jgi:hypothetical protein
MKKFKNPDSKIKLPGGVEITPGNLTDEVYSNLIKEIPALADQFEDAAPDAPNKSKKDA